MEASNPQKSALTVNEGIAQPEQLNQSAIERLKAVKKKPLAAQAYVDGILQGDMVLLSQAITLAESSLVEHQELAQQIIGQCLPHTGKATRLGITGVPGAGKSTFIEALGMHLVNQGHKLAVLAIDPSSQRSKGSILGDKTRMEMLANHPSAYIRPSASSGTLGGVARKTRESIILCEAAGFDTIFVETVGVGQSETAVHAMVDFFLLLLISGAGDELQGIKRGIMEMADGIAVNKADGDNIHKANRAKAECENALHLFPLAESGVKPLVMTCSAITGSNIDAVWKMVTDFIDHTSKNGYLEEKRKNQAVQVMHETIEETLRNHFYQHELIQKILSETQEKVRSQQLTAYVGAQQLLESYFNRKA